MNRCDFKVCFVSFYNEAAYGLRQLHAIVNHLTFSSKMIFIKLRLEDSFTKKTNNVTDIEESLFIDYIKENKPDVMAFSLVSSNFTLYRRLFKRIRPLGDFKIVLGGWQVSLNPEKCIDYCDILCIGEGELIIGELIECLYKKQSIDHISNLWIRAGSETIKNSVGPLLTDFDTIPIQTYKDELSLFIDNNIIIQHDPYLKSDRYGTFLGRGCPYHCTYCSNSYMAAKIYPNQWSKVRLRSVENAICELLEAKRNIMTLKYIIFYDEVFSPNIAYVQQFFDRYLKEIGLPFYCMFYPGTCSEEMAIILKNSMLAGVWMGIQSGSERVRKEVFKRRTNSKSIIKQAQIFNKYNISVKYDIIFDNPFETFDESLETIELLLNLPQPFKINAFSLKFFPNTEITQMALDSGMITDENLNDALEDDHQDTKVTIECHNNNLEFLNLLAMYIAILAPNSFLNSKIDYIRQTINTYKCSGNYDKLKNDFVSLSSDIAITK
ncbi:radical SAM domain-containing protein [Candidatus Magnetobacterium bavaricum]|uniref:Radical SAM domain-containing protein n=1 Tax=Candidatus Magnetobacterium bavaricum TaxID=29290 RepID=A0A0F3GJL4_9BACT|nr:radical SAM domain-containing protein [Candidatus Magnetobacterium bavaricum]